MTGALGIGRPVGGVFDVLFEGIEQERGGESESNCRRYSERDSEKLTATNERSSQSVKTNIYMHKNRWI